MGNKIHALGFAIEVRKVLQNDYISITDIAKYKNPQHSDDVIKNWLRNRNTIELLGFWEYIHNPDFKPVEFDGFRKEAITVKEIRRGLEGLWQRIFNRTTFL